LFNVQSVVTKLLELQYIMYNSDYDCIFITESWLHDGIYTTELLIPLIPEACTLRKISVLYSSI